MAAQMNRLDHLHLEAVPLAELRQRARITGMFVPEAEIRAHQHGAGFEPPGQDVVHERLRR